jgi:hypothetical protein
VVGIICNRFAFQICPIDKRHQHSQGIENFSLYCIGARNLMRFFTFLCLLLENCTRLIEDFTCFQVLVPVSMQKETPTCTTYKQLNSITGEGVFNMSSLSLPEGRVHGGSLKSLFLRRGNHPSSQTESAGTFTLDMSSSLSIDMRQPTLITQEGLDASYTEHNSRVPQFGYSGLEKTDLNCSLSVDGNVFTSGVDLN